ncbi:MAG: hypothetical protein ACLFQV_12055 [Vulcanimicrobiota bacterium]
MSSKLIHFFLTLKKAVAVVMKDESGEAKLEFRRRSRGLSESAGAAIES